MSLSKKYYPLFSIESTQEMPQHECKIVDCDIFKVLTQTNIPLFKSLASLCSVAKQIVLYLALSQTLKTGPEEYKTFVMLNSQA